MKFSAVTIFALFVICAKSATAFTVQQQTSTALTTQLAASGNMDRRDFGNAIYGTMAAAAAAATAGLTGNVEPANAQVFFDPAQYGDQELRVSAVDSLKESVRRAILKEPKLAPSFYQLSLLDSLSYNAQTKDFGPDASVLKVVLSSKDTDDYTLNLQKAALALVDAEKNLRKKTAITLADAVAIGGAEAVESIGGPVLPVQLGRADAPLKAPVSSVPMDLFSGRYSSTQVTKYFLQAGVTEREMTALLAGLLTIENVEKSRTTEDWRQSTKPKFREAGKMGRMSEFKRLTEEDIAEAEAQAALEADPDYEDPDDGWYIADSFGTKETRFGQRIGAEQISEKNFNTFLKEISEKAKKKGDLSGYGWIASMLMDPATPTCQTWLTKYAGSNLNYIKDLSISFNAITQLGAVYTGGKYENLLKNKPRKSLNNDDLNLF
uniref:Plant heme peroxidase family profile domain-containing protein n=1 Tax=Entomoneis paludosa TaxID=265537 RepID=A0A7S2VE21_9STRA|mmetsp:Transcript_14514/g.29969  ORF Transcript_14514/g.29969 Transcript_14514/m.29969 type:complete len:436 (+) Transcript_14514:99-1406(+)|eukprot:CAMPEP_0172470824 /NCGR_PEP_ID=MMETSP1065-20121228/67351_1 /TAXON_ID=265537 /ORGANISM="Amphiprora paludosa, Strain CCMP125" /LENGTH=435 /DNA_ID=CAMNT_0013228875 /DNA_START=55 /DNA_END=1362 /DNA_ORIENTATION=-